MGQREEWVPGLKALALFKAKPGDWPGINLDLEKVLISLYCQQYYSDMCVCVCVCVCVCARTLLIYKALVSRAGMLWYDPICAYTHSNIWKKM